MTNLITAQKMTIVEEYELVIFNCVMENCKFDNIEV